MVYRFFVSLTLPNLIKLVIDALPHAQDNSRETRPLLL